MRRVSSTLAVRSSFGIPLSTSAISTSSQIMGLEII